MCADIADPEDVYGVSQDIGNPDILAAIRARSLAHAHSPARHAGAVRGVETLAASLCLQIHKFVSTLGDLAAKRRPASGPPTSRDDEILAIPGRDGRLSNREVARQLNISDSAVRQRINCMTRDGVMQFEVVRDPLGMGVTALLRISTAAGCTPGD